MDLHIKKVWLPGAASCLLFFGFYYVLIWLLFDKYRFQFMAIPYLVLVIRRNYRYAQLTPPVARDGIRDVDRPGSGSPRLGSLLEPNGRLTHRRPQQRLNCPECQAPSSRVAGRDCSA